MVNKCDIIRGLRELGVSCGDVLEVHSSLSSFGSVEGGAETVISALKECCGEEGSIFMPALRLSPERELTSADKALGIVSKIEILPVNRARSAMGIIADTFRAQSDVVTGDDVFAVSGWGKHAAKALESGLDFAINNGGKAIMFGVDIYKLTAMHYAEGSMPSAINEIFAPSEEVNALYPPDKWLVEMGRPPVMAWYTIERMAREKGLIRDGKIGKCDVMCFLLRDIVGIYERELKNNPYALYGLAQ